VMAVHISNLPQDFPAGKSGRRWCKKGQFLLVISPKFQPSFARLTDSTVGVPITQCASWSPALMV
jgi:hypothetical protein